MQRLILPIKDIVDFYKNGEKTKSLADRYGCHHTTIQRLLRKQGVLKPLRFNNVKYTVDENYFDEINSSDKAYWLGIMLTDGCVDKNNHIRINLQTRDEGHILKFQKAIGSNHPLLRVKEGKTGTSCLSIGNKYMASVLREKGIVPYNKLVYQVPKEFEIDYWRGAIDGDGYVSFGTHCAIGICGTEQICSCFKEICRRYIKTNAKIKKMKCNLYTFSLHGNIAVIMCKVLYDGASVYLQRKQEAYLKGVELLKERKYGINLDWLK
jgi:hypothetical protein